MNLSCQKGTDSQVEALRKESNILADANTHRRQDHPQPEHPPEHSGYILTPTEPCLVLLRATLVPTVSPMPRPTPNILRRSSFVFCGTLTALRDPLFYTRARFPRYSLYRKYLKIGLDEFHAVLDAVGLAHVPFVDFHQVVRSLSQPRPIRVVGEYEQVGSKTVAGVRPNRVFPLSW